MNVINCIFCGIKDGRVLIEENGYCGKKCSRCGLIYISPRPSLAEIVDLYGHDDAHVSARSHIDSAFPKRLYASHHLSVIRRYIDRGDLLEIGAGAGYFMDEARKLGFAPHGLEFNVLQAQFMTEQLKLPCESSPLSDAIFGGKKFDVVYHCDVISHFYDPIAEFRNMHKVMKDDALLAFETGNLGGTDEKYLKHIESFQYPDHLFFFNENNLITLLEKTGFELLEIRRYSLIPHLYLMKPVSLMKKLSGKGGVPTRASKTETKATTSRTESLSVIAPRTGPRVWIKNIWEYVVYLFRYRVGAIAPKKGRPQTLLVIARRIRRA